MTDNENSIIFVLQLINFQTKIKFKNNMNFSNITLLGKGVTRRTTAGQTRESEFSFRYSRYTKTNKAGLEEKVNQFVFTRGGIDTLGVAGPSTSAAPFHDTDNGIVGIAIVAADKGNFLAPSKRSQAGKKSNTVTVPSLFNALVAEGMINPDFEGSHYFDVKLLGSDDNGSYFQVVPSTIEPKAYVAGEAEEVEDADLAPSTNEAGN